MEVAATVAWLMLALLAGLVMPLNVSNGRRPGPGEWNIGAAIFLGQFSSFIALAGLRLPTGIAQGSALMLGVAAVWTEL